jgi:hypothetical protein
VAPIGAMLLSILASDVDTASKVLAADTLKFVCRQKVEKPVLQSQFAAFFSEDLNENFAPFLTALCPILRMVALHEGQFNFLFRYLQGHCEMSPLARSCDEE